MNECGERIYACLMGREIPEKPAEQGRKLGTYQRESENFKLKDLLAMVCEKKDESASS